MSKQIQITVKIDLKLDVEPASDLPEVLKCFEGDMKRRLISSEIDESFDAATDEVWARTKAHSIGFNASIDRIVCRARKV